MKFRKRRAIFLFIAWCFTCLVPGNGLRAPRSFADDRKQRPSTDFTGIELGAGILNAVRQPKRIDDWSQPEIDAYYRVLVHARNTDYEQQKRRAKSNLHAEVERFRQETEREYSKRIKQIDQNAGKLGLLQRTRLKNAVSARRRKRLSLAERYKNDPAEFRMFTRIANSLLAPKAKAADRKRFHGKLVTLNGHIRRLVSYPAHENRFGVKQLHEAWIYTKNSSKNPAVIICTSIPKGIPTGERILEEVSVTGFVFRIHKYPDKGGKIHYAPMILASTIEWKPRKEPDQPPNWWAGGVIAVVVLIIATIALIGRRDKAFHRKQIDEMMQDGEPEPRIAPPEE